MKRNVLHKRKVQGHRHTIVNTSKQFNMPKAIDNTKLTIKIMWSQSISFRHFFFFDFYTYTYIFKFQISCDNWMAQLNFGEIVDSLLLNNVKRIKFHKKTKKKSKYIFKKKKQREVERDLLEYHFNFNEGDV